MLVLIRSGLARFRAVVWQGHASGRPDRIRAAQVAMLFRTVTLGVVSATLAAIMLAGALITLGGTTAAAGVPWAMAVALCAMCHLELKRRYDRAPAPSRTEWWWSWGAAFAVICMAEGCLWGWASVALAAPDRYSLQLLVMLVTYAVAAGAIPTFGSYLPAFWLLFVPVSGPFALHSLCDGRLEQEFGGALATLYVAGMAGLGVRYNGELKAILRLGFEKEDLADRLVREKERAEEANLAKSRFLAAASHDLRQPVHALGLFVSALRGSQMGPEARSLVGQVEASVGALGHLFDALLNVSQLDAHVVANQPLRFRVQPLLERICREHADEAAAKNIGLHLHPCGLCVHADPLHLERVLRNLVSNAVRYTGRGRVVVGCRRGTGLLRIEVWDTGPGIPTALQERVFEEFFQLGNPERDRSKGLGLGLAIVRRLAALMDVALTMRSLPGRGSVFAVTVPLAGDVDDAIPADTRPEPRQAEGALILVVDDETAIRNAMESLLRRWGYSVITAGSGAEMLRSVESCPVRPALLICDYRLRGGEDGLAVIRRMQEEYNDELPALLITGDTAPERLLDATTSGLLLLHKPVAEAALLDAITRLTTATPDMTGAPRAVRESVSLASLG